MVAYALKIDYNIIFVVTMRNILTILTLLFMLSANAQNWVQTTNPNRAKKIGILSNDSTIFNQLMFGLTTSGYTISSSDKSAGIITTHKREMQGYAVVAYASYFVQVNVACIKTDSGYFAQVIPQFLLKPGPAYAERYIDLDSRSERQWDYVAKIVETIQGKYYYWQKK